MKNTLALTKMFSFYRLLPSRWNALNVVNLYLDATHNIYVDIYILTDYKEVCSLHDM